MNLLEIVKQACREMALPIPNAVATSSDQQVIQLFGLINAIGTELLDTHDFQGLVEETTFVTAGTGTASLPADFHRPLNSTQWDRSNRWALSGPVLPMGWQWLKSSQLASVGPIVRFRISGGTFQYYPTTDTGNTFAYEYIKKNWVIDQDGTTEKSMFENDLDTCIFRDRLMIACLKWRFFEAKGFDATAYQRTAMQQIDAQANEAGAPTLTLSEGDSRRFIDLNNIPDSGYGS